MDLIKFKCKEDDTVFYLIKEKALSIMQDHPIYCPSCNSDVAQLETTTYKSRFKIETMEA